MAENATIIGRVAVRVHPHTKGFRAEAQRDLERIEKQLKPIHVKVKPVLDEKAMRDQVRTTIKESTKKDAEMKVRFNPDSLASVNRVINGLERDLEKLGEVEVDINRKSADDLEQALDELRESLWVELRVDENSERSLERAIKQIDSELDKLREVDLRVDLDEESLRRVKDELQDKLDEQVNVRVDLDRKASQGLLDKVQSTLDRVQLSPTLDEDKARKVRRDIERLLFKKEDLKKSITPEMLPAEKRKVLRDIEEIDDKLRDLENTEVEVEVELAEVSYRATAARLAMLARDRTMKIRPVLDNAATRKVGTTLAALSGARSVGTILQDLSQWISNLDKALPLIGSVALAVAGIGAAGITSVSNLAALSYSLAQIAGAGLLLPGIFGGVVIGVGTMIAALKDFNTVLPEVKQEFSEFQDLISSNFWAKAKKPMQGFFQDILPRFRDGLDKTSTSLGNYFAALSNALTGEFNQGLGGMFEDLSKSIDIASEGTIDFAKSLRILGELGAGYLPRLAGWVNDVAEKWATWLEVNEKNGRLKELADAGIANLKSLGNAVVDFGGILAGIGRAATKGGGSPLETFAATMERVHKVVDTPAFQNGLARVFKAAHTAMSNIAEESGPGVKKFFESLPGLAERVLPVAGRTIGKALGSIADALGNKKLQDGIVALFEGIEKAVDGLAPAMPSIAEAFGVLGDVLGDLLAAVGPVLGDLLKAMADAFVEMGPSLKEVVTALSGSFQKAVEWLIPKLPELTDAFIELLDFVADHPDEILAIAAAITAISIAAPGVASLISGIATAIGGISTTTLAGVAGGLGGVALALAGFALIPGDTAKEKIETVTDSFDTSTEATKDLGDALNELKDVVFPDLRQVLRDNQMVVKGWSENFKTAMETASAIVEFVLTGIEMRIRFFTLIWDAIWRTFGSTISTTFGGIFEGINRIVNGGLENLKLLFQAATALLEGDWRKAWDKITQIPGNAMIVLGGIVDVGIAFIKGVFSAAKDALGTISEDTWNDVGKAFSSGVSAVGKTVGGLPGIIVGALGDTSLLLYQSGVNVVGGLVKGISDSVRAAITAAQAMAKAVIGAANSTFNINSPSRVFRSIGHSVGEGLELGTRDSITANEKAAHDLAASTISAARSVTAGITVSSQTATAAAAPAAGDQYNLNVDAGGSGASAEDIADALLFGIRRASIGGRYA